MNNQVLQSGQVTPRHLASWTTDGVIQDAGVTFVNALAFYRADALGVNFNATNQDFPISINLPVGFTRWRPLQIFISGASGTLTTATCSLWTQPGGFGGTNLAIVANSTAVTITTNLSDTVNNMQQINPINNATLALIDTTVYFRVQNPQGVVATANVTVTYEPLP